MATKHARSRAGESTAARPICCQRPPGVSVVDVQKQVIGAAAAITQGNPRICMHTPTCHSSSLVYPCRCPLTPSQLLMLLAGCTFVNSLLLPGFIVNFMCCCQASLCSSCAAKSSPRASASASLDVAEALLLALDPHPLLLLLKAAAGRCGGAAGTAAAAKVDKVVSKERLLCSDSSIVTVGEPGGST
jgi:hypothetical protein